MHDDEWTFNSMEAKIDSLTFHTWGLNLFNNLTIFTPICRWLLVMASHPYMEIIFIHTNIYNNNNNNNNNNKSVYWQVQWFCTVKTTFKEYKMWFDLYMYPAWLDLLHLRVKMIDCLKSSYWCKCQYFIYCMQFKDIRLFEDFIRAGKYRPSYLLLLNEQIIFDFKVKSRNIGISKKHVVILLLLEVNCRECLQKWW